MVQLTTALFAAVALFTGAQAACPANGVFCGSELVDVYQSSQIDSTHTQPFQPHPLPSQPRPPGPEPQLPLSRSHAHPQSHFHPSPFLSPPTSPSHSNTPKTNASLYFIGNATTFLAYHSARILTDPNFLHASYHVHLGPGVTATRTHNPIVDFEGLPGIDCILLSHYHGDHFDQLVEDKLNRDVLIVTSEHAAGCLTQDEKGFRRVKGLGFWEGMALPIQGTEEDVYRPGPLAVADELLGAVPPTNGWMVELGYLKGQGEEMEMGHRIYILGDTLFVDELKGIPEWLNGETIDLMLVHLGGTTIPGPKMPLGMLVDPEMTVSIHLDDYDVMLLGLDDFKEVEAAGLSDRVVYLDRGEECRLQVGEGK
ncbi:hypothetical protein B0T14DRAFT_546454 [Immersiella caudata]|uniref:Metallo-beta-lactamase domain-containing protein n=1 Tax=Immersiella caudata TaxID=314043 RepID=A0AA39WSE3_9PEZI|nr:hypothetical protein B0T14DRAFT_546454 [Immersiella caudata]